MAVSRWQVALVIAMLLTSGPESRAQLRSWSVVPSIGLRGTYTDNALFVAAPEHGDFVTSISPGISINGQGPRLTANLAYTGNLLFYSNSSEQNRLANTLNGSANFKAIENFLFLDANANISQSYISPFGARPSDITTAAANRTETRSLSLSPYIRSTTPGGYSYEARYRNTLTTTDTSSLADVYTETVSSNIASPIDRFGWSLDGNRTKIHYAYSDETRRPDSRSSIIRGRFYYQPDTAVRLWLTAGNESNNYVLQQEQSYSIYGYGALWKPTPTTTAQYSWERRFFGPAPFASFEHRTPLSAWTLTYSKDVSSYQQQLFAVPPGDTTALLDTIFSARITDPARRQQAVQQFMQANGTPAFLANSLAFYTQQVFLRERLQGSFAILGARNSITFTAFAANDASVSTPPPGLPADVFAAFNSHIKQKGYGANATHQISGLTALTGSATRTNADTEETSVRSKNDFYSLSLTHRISPKTDTFAGLSYQTFESDVVAATSRSRSVYAGLYHSF